MWPWCGGSSRAHRRGSPASVPSAFPEGRENSECPAPALPTLQGSKARPAHCEHVHSSQGTARAGRVGRRRRLTHEQSEVPPASHTWSPRPVLLGFSAAEHPPPPALEEEPKGAPSPPRILLETTRTLDKEVVKISCSHKNETWKESILTASGVGSPGP